MMDDRELAWRARPVYVSVERDPTESGTFWSFGKEGWFRLRHDHVVAVLVARRNVGLSCQPVAVWPPAFAYLPPWSRLKLETQNSDTPKDAAVLARRLHGVAGSHKTKL